ncbi:MAG: EAL domain-containing protein, partial [Chromatiales bacterium]|nr:EAL domain-containing protein [Chromatiales bacterium]
VARRHGEKQWVARVKHALTEDRFFLDVQPIIGVARSERPQRLYEILVRMQDEQGNIVPPGAFLPAVERYNLATRLDLWVIGKTLDWMSANPEQIEDIARFFINLSADTLSEVSSADAICELLMAHDLPAHKICFEITEAAAIANLSRSNQLIKKLRNRGCKFSLDDFGTGLSSFAYLKALPVDYLKIDGLYVRDIANDPIDYEVVRAINDVGHVMGKEIIAEAVESDQVLAKLEGIGVDYAQGFALGRPRTIDDLASVEFQIFEGGAA